jgi:anaerobic ribonucleoside-triphosphate reductase activating protein
MVLQNVKLHFPEVKTYLWTGYYYEELLKMTDPKVKIILDMVDVLIDGPYKESKRDVTLKMRGSSNQSIINLKEKRNGRS